MIILESITNCHTKALPRCHTDYSCHTDSPPCHTDSHCHTERSEVSQNIESRLVIFASVGEILADCTSECEKSKTMESKKILTKDFKRDFSFAMQTQNDKIATCHTDSPPCHTERSEVSAMESRFFAYGSK
ncbi:hypothetical protein [Helicobacter sp.]|uniref:hypothetical protein n=1 Tax=Helicobacter sp. TaxID=218 RepID=UPI00388F88CC